MLLEIGYLDRIDPGLEVADPRAGRSQSATTLKAWLGTNDLETRIFRQRWSTM